MSSPAAAATASKPTDPYVSTSAAGPAAAGNASAEKGKLRPRSSSISLAAAGAAIMSVPVNLPIPKAVARAKIPASGSETPPTAYETLMKRRMGLVHKDPDSDENARLLHLFAQTGKMTSDTRAAGAAPHKSAANTESSAHASAVGTQGSSDGSSDAKVDSQPKAFIAFKHKPPAHATIGHPNPLAAAGQQQVAGAQGAAAQATSGKKKASKQLTVENLD